MSLKRVGILLGNEIFQGPKNFFLIWAVIAPVVISLVFSLIFGTLFTDKPKLGILDKDNSQLVDIAMQQTSITTKEYTDAARLRQDVEDGVVDVALILPVDFDNDVKESRVTRLTVYVWGESLAKDRTILGITVVNLIREMSGYEASVEIESVILGDEVSIPWSERLLPLVVLIAVFIGGIFLPATSVINEKEKKTLQALVVTPASAIDVFAAKGIFGIILSLFMGIVILVLNQAFGVHPLLLIIVLALGAVMAVAVGLLCGIYIKDITTLFAIFKSGGIILYAPAIFYMFPNLPQWIGRIFPTYYIMQPIMDISQSGGGWPEIAANVFVLIALDIVIIGAFIFMLSKKRQFGD